MSERRLLTARQVAEDTFGFSLDWFYRNRRRLEAAGFPRPVVGPRTRLYDPVAIDDWLDFQLRPIVKVTTPEDVLTYRAKAIAAALGRRH